MRLYLLVPVLFCLLLPCNWVTVTCTMVSSSYVWGAVADQKGRKPVIITSVRGPPNSAEFVQILAFQIKKYKEAV